MERWSFFFGVWKKIIIFFHGGKLAGPCLLGDFIVSQLNSQNYITVLVKYLDDPTIKYTQDETVDEIVGLPLPETEQSDAISLTKIFRCGLHWDLRFLRIWLKYIFFSFDIETCLYHPHFILYAFHFDH
jgi:hypothetical protein